MELNIYHISEHQTTDQSDFSDDKHIYIFRQTHEATKEFDDFLTKMMSAVKINLSDHCNLINIKSGQKVSIQPTLRHNHNNKLLFFGIPPQSVLLDLNIPPYHCITLLNHQLLFTDTLAQVMPSKERKAKLWIEMKYMFKLK